MDPTTPSPDDDLDPGLLAAFGVAKDDSVLARLAPSGDPMPSVLLREEAESRAVRVGQAGARTQGRYQIVGEIARGGVGVVLRGRDVDLGRDVAMKVLREEYGSRPDVLQRFVEEAQIGGQLQHPGIVPVYELGMGKDRRPFFTMKLVKGRTLAALLTERPSPAQDRLRFLRIFESICQTMAYAHARGVIHRDLKPANVMVGAFGEVLVVDWGMGKVLREGGIHDEKKARRAPPPDVTFVGTGREKGTGSPSVEGSIMGTPRYMPPEQALGDVDAMDERSDVFALGATLCEILAGVPPYAGASEEAVMQAARGLVDEAFARLDACGADPEIVAVAKRCLAPLAKDRPLDAGVVSKAVGAHLASVEERAHTAHEAAAEAKVVAREERRRRKVTLALAAAVVALLVVGGGAWALVASEQRDRTDAATRRTSAAAEEASRLQGLAQSAPDDVEGWKAAAASAAKAVALAEDADPGARSKAEALHASLAAEERAATGRALARQRDADFSARLDEIRSTLAETWDGKQAAAEYEKAFRDRGWDVDALPAEVIAAEVEKGSIRERVVVALDRWVKHAGNSEARRTKLGALVARLDPDPWRGRLRKASTPAELSALADEADVERMPIESLLGLVYRLDTEGDRARAAALAERVADRHPSDYWARFQAGRTNDEPGEVPIGGFEASADKRRLLARLRSYAAAVALRPLSAGARHNYGNALREAGDHASAMKEYAAALRGQPDSAALHNNVGIVLHRDGDLDGAEKEMRAAIRLDPGQVPARANLGLLLKQRGRLDEAVVVLEEALGLDPKSSNARNTLAQIHSARGEHAAAVAAYREAVRLSPKAATPWSNLGVVLLRVGQLAEAVEASREAVRLRPDVAAHHFNLGVALERVGNDDEALRAYEEALRIDPRRAAHHGGLGNALFAAGRLAEAEAAYRTALRIDPKHAMSQGNLGSVLGARQDHAGAIEAFRRAIELDPKFVHGHASLGVGLRLTGDLVGAEAALREAMRLDPRYGLTWFQLGFLFEAKGDSAEVVKALEEALRLDPKHDEAPLAYLKLGEAYQRLGRYDDAAQAFARGRAASAGTPGEKHPWDGLEADARLCLALAPRFDGAIAGRDIPATGLEGFTLALMCRHAQRHGTAVRFFAEATRKDPAVVADVTQQRGFNAAIDALLASSGQGVDASEATAEQRVLWRGQALGWLREELARWEKVLDEQPRRLLPATVKTVLSSWKTNPTLAPIRDHPSVEALPASERAALMTFWWDVDRVLARAVE